MDGVFKGPASYALADWRRRINDLYAQVRQAPDPAAAHALWVRVRSDMFRGHAVSPLGDAHRAGFPGIEVFSYDPAWRFAVDLQPVTGPETTHDLGADGTLAMRPLARTLGLEPVGGAELTVYWITGYGGGLFLPFRDASNGDATFGGGRYLADAIKGADLGLAADGKLILDFNFAYTPSCAWNDAFVCPLSPPENTLPAHVLAGERAPPRI